MEGGKVSGEDDLGFVGLSLGCKAQRRKSWFSFASYRTAFLHRLHVGQTYVVHFGWLF